MTSIPTIPYTRRPWAVRLALILILLGSALNLLYLWHNCPLNLAEDEAHYWEWSRHLDYGYYSKPAGIAWLHFAANSLAQTLGIPQDAAHTMPVLRSAAVALSILSGLLSMNLARRLFRDDRAALMVTILSAAVPMFVVGALLITIDAPMYACWAAAVYALWRQIDTPSKSPAWLYAAALATGLGMLFKPVLIAIPLCALVAAFLCPIIRAKLQTLHAALAALLILAMQTPVLLWNMNHDWVTFRHIGGQAGVGQSSKHWFDPLARIGSFLGGQAGGMGGVLFVLLVIAVLTTIKTYRQRPAQSPAQAFLLAFTLPLWLFYLALNLVAGTQPNWPAAAYFTGMILLAGVATRFWTAGHRAWRHWTIGAVLWGLVLATLGQNMHWFYPLVAPKVAAAQKNLKPGDDPTRTSWHPRRWDLTYRLRGLQERAAAIQKIADEMAAAHAGRPPLIATTRYDTSSSLSFYLPGQPFVYCLMSRVGGRHNQYDFWPGLNEQRPDGTLLHAGADLLLVIPEGNLPDEVMETVLRPAFTRVGEKELVDIYYQGILYRQVAIRRCYGFQGLPAPAQAGHW